MTCGTYTSYVKRGCRCADCRRANTDQQLAQQRRKRSPNTLRPGLASANVHRLFPLLTPLDLVDHGACRGHHDTMFLGDAARTDRLRYLVHQQQITEAHALCAKCPVLNVCRQWALSAPDPVPYHYAGDLTPRQRDVIRRGGEGEITTKARGTR